VVVEFRFRILIVFRILCGHIAIWLDWKRQRNSVLLRTLDRRILSAADDRVGARAGHNYRSRISLNNFFGDMLDNCGNLGGDRNGNYADSAKNVLT